MGVGSGKFVRIKIIWKFLRIRYLWGIVTGKHNISNSLGVIYLAKKLGEDMQEVRAALEKFKGAKRRFDIVYENGITVVDDYAHHPSEIKATLNAARQRSKGKVVAVFQPHRYSRISSLIDDFKGCFNDADEIVLLPIYSAGEKNTYGISSEILAEKIVANLYCSTNRINSLNYSRKNKNNANQQTAIS